MTDCRNRPAEFWDDLEHTVARTVKEALLNRRRPRLPLIEYLRQVEEMARTECDRRQTVQIIASGRSLLGDRRTLGPDRSHVTENATVNCAFFAVGNSGWALPLT